MRLTAQAEAERIAGRLDRAQALGERARELARAQGERGHEARALLALASIAAERAPRAAAQVEEYGRLALALGQALGMRGVVARARSLLAPPAR
jgi:hypothetical protein